jgi:hypothetical protein
LVALPCSEKPPASITDDNAVYRDLSGETSRFFGRFESEWRPSPPGRWRQSWDGYHRTRHSGPSCVAAFQGPDSEKDLSDLRSLDFAAFAGECRFAVGPSLYYRSRRLCNLTTRTTVTAEANQAGSTAKVDGSCPCDPAAQARTKNRNWRRDPASPLDA